MREVLRKTRWFPDGLRAEQESMITGIAGDRAFQPRFACEIANAFAMGGALTFEFLDDGKDIFVRADRCTRDNANAGALCIAYERWVV